MDKLIIRATDNLPVEAAKDTMPVPVEGKTLYITPENKDCTKIKFLVLRSEERR